MNSTYINEHPLHYKSTVPKGELVTIENEEFFRISDYDQMDPFFMTIVSHSDHWMFISSNGGLSAGRKNEDSPLFPYYTDDKITDSAHLTGSFAAFRVSNEGKQLFWQPFSTNFRYTYDIDRNLFKSKWGNKIYFEEFNRDLNLRYRYGWSFSEKFGFVKTARLYNESAEKLEIEVLDGLQNIVPFGISSALQNNRSNLANAYKRSELHKKSGVGIFALSAMIIDRAEPSEALKATSCWSTGLSDKSYLLSSLQIDRFLRGETLREETDIKAAPGAYLMNNSITLQPNSAEEWSVIAEVNQSQPQIRNLIHRIVNDAEGLSNELNQDILSGTAELKAKVAKADGLQQTGDEMMVGRHYSNVLYNIMRGGIFDDDYQIDSKDFKEYLERHNKILASRHGDFISNQGKQISYQQLVAQAEKTGDRDLTRLAIEYLPLSFSRRHGDPSRPWNKFSIQLSKDNGEKERYYQGNWRDIFQNWEALALSFPAYISGMIYKFVNATTADGYNPYRISRDGIDWEEIEPDDPWSYIGYWGDHQIIYLQKLLEIMQEHYPGGLARLLTSEEFVYANVPYRIKPFEEIAADPKNTVDFDAELSARLRKLARESGADAKLLLADVAGLVPFKASFIEKLLVTLLTKIYNYVPDAGIWLNTQRPEWNDANNALVGNGCSMVTLYYMRRFTRFLIDLLKANENEAFGVSHALSELMKKERDVLSDFESSRQSGFSGQDRKNFAFKMGSAGENYRRAVYQEDLKSRDSIQNSELIAFLESFLEYADSAIDTNKREDGLFHAYNLIDIKKEEVSVSYLYEMLEGQVAVLSSGYLSSSEVLDVLNSLKSSSMYREDQYSYLLYPNRDIPGFFDRNDLKNAEVETIKLVSSMLDKGDHRLIEKDINGTYYFNGSLHNVNDVKKVIEDLKLEGKNVSAAEVDLLYDLWENTFNHKAFTGRSGTFFGYEGLGSIYWHMVSKLLLATQETLRKAQADGEDPQLIGRLIDHYYEIRAGIGINKSPSLYGAFPTDPYSHTPYYKGAQQPGMTGQVKEDILNRWAELGVRVHDGCLYFEPGFMAPEEWLGKEAVFEYFDGSGVWQNIDLSAGQLAFTYCQIPVIYQKAGKVSTTVLFSNGKEQVFEGRRGLSAELTKSVFDRKFDIVRITVDLDA